MKIVYKSDDGKEFDTPAQCEDYEKQVLAEAKITAVKKKIEAKVEEFCDCDRYEGYNQTDIAEFIFNHITDLNSIIAEKE